MSRLTEHERNRPPAGNTKMKLISTDVVNRCPKDK